MAKYIMQEMPDLQGKGKKAKYPKMLIDNMYSHKSIVEEIAQRTSFTEGDVEGMIVALSETIAYRMAEGNSVKVCGLGVFKPKLGLRAGAPEEREGSSKRNAASIEVTDVQYKADKALVLRVGKNCRLERGRSRSYTDHKAGKEKRAAELMAYLSEHHFIRVGQYSQLTGLSTSSAGKELRELATEGLVARRGRGAHLIYISPTKGED